ncbi:hypothetical protein B0H12DRAFT_1145749 [Mycena haematopus]|nr:hypothetical protein B0H12DRAFT_1145749 [Mycena haematopus]
MHLLIVATPASLSLTNSSPAPRPIYFEGPTVHEIRHPQSAAHFASSTVPSSGHPYPLASHLAASCTPPLHTNVRVQPRGRASRVGERWRMEPEGVARTAHMNDARKVASWINFIIRRLG